MLVALLILIPLTALGLVLGMARIEETLLSDPLSPPAAPVAPGAADTAAARTVAGV